MQKAEGGPGKGWPGFPSRQGGPRATSEGCWTASSLPRLTLLTASLWFPMTQPGRESRAEERRSERRRERREEVRGEQPEECKWERNGVAGGDTQRDRERRWWREGGQMRERGGIREGEWGRENEMQERSGERHKVRTEPEKPGQASARSPAGRCGPAPCPPGPAAGQALRGRAQGVEGGAREGLPVGGDHVVPAHSFFFSSSSSSPSRSFFTSFSFLTGKSVREAVSVFPPGPVLPNPGPPLPSGRELPLGAGVGGGGGRGDRARGQLPRRHMAAAAPRAPRGAAPASPKVRRLRPAGPEPSSG